MILIDLCHQNSNRLRRMTSNVDYLWYDLEDLNKHLVMFTSFISAGSSTSSSVTTSLVFLLLKDICSTWFGRVHAQIVRKSIWKLLTSAPFRHQVTHLYTRRSSSALNHSVLLIQGYFITVLFEVHFLSSIRSWENFQDHKLKVEFPDTVPWTEGYIEETHWKLWRRKFSSPDWVFKSTSERSCFRKAFSGAYWGARGFWAHFLCCFSLPLLWAEWILFYDCDGSLNSGLASSRFFIRRILSLPHGFSSGSLHVLRSLIQFYLSFPLMCMLEKH